MMSVFYGGDPEFSRVAQDLVPVRNDSIHHNVNTIQYYWSLSSANTSATPIISMKVRRRFRLAIPMIPSLHADSMMRFLPYSASRLFCRVFFWKKRIFISGNCMQAFPPVWNFIQKNHFLPSRQKAGTRLRIFRKTKSAANMPTMNPFTALP